MSKTGIKFFAVLMAAFVLVTITSVGVFPDKGATVVASSEAVSD